MNILTIISLISTFLFASSASIMAIRKQLDIVGIFFVSFLAGIGGGTFRDLILGTYPITWVKHPYHLLIIIVAVGLTLLFRENVLKPSKAFFTFDSLGLGAATVLGIQKAVNADINPLMAVLFGVISACFGGVIRDVLCNEIPLVFRKELYATASIIGGLFFISVIYAGMEEYTASIISVLLVFLIRIVSVRFNLTMPIVKLKSENNIYKFKRGK
ncbi:MAG: trimeric intracellular cation channel family protein [Ignavibacteriae bacterium]|nr:trimeric intracellular cation channel family protein [Ignavibacteriota bacterium]